MINIKITDDNECFKWCLSRCLNPVDHHSARITKADQDFAKMLDFKDINFPVKIREIHKIPSALAFIVMKIKKNIQSIYPNNAV